MPLANWRSQLATIDQRLAVLNPLLADLGLPAQAPPPFHPPPETGRGAGDARHNAATFLLKFRQSLDNQIEKAKKDIAAGKGKTSNRETRDFYKAPEGTARDFGSPAPTSRASDPPDTAPASSDPSPGLLWAFAGVGLYLILLRR